jgi:GT2 family glycosyltransferase
VTRDVVVGYLHGDTVTQEFHHCLQNVLVHDIWHSQRVCRWLGKYSGCQINRVRNELVIDMLADERAEWLWMLDQDATFPADMLDALLADADPDERPIVGALAHQLRGRTDDDGPVMDAYGMQQTDVVPTMYQLVRDDKGNYSGYREIAGYPLGLNEVDATGAHCLLVHRSVFEAIKSDHPYRWFREDEIAPGLIAGEDIWFCLQARALNIPIYVDTRLESGHVKRQHLTSLQSTTERHT